MVSHQVADVDRVTLDLLRIENLPRHCRTLVWKKSQYLASGPVQSCLSCLKDDGCVQLVKAGQPKSAGVRVKRKSAVVDGTDEFYLRVEDVDNFYKETNSRVTIKNKILKIGTFLNYPSFSLG